MLLERRSLLRRLHAVAGLVPVAAFLAFHLFVNARAARGADAYNAAAHRLQQVPLAVAAELALIALPLAFHGIVGLFLIAAVPAAADRATRGGRRLAAFQRVTGVYLFAFILFHLWTTRLVQLEDHESLDLFHLMQAALASPWIRLFYQGGVLAATGHLAVGIGSLPRTWDLAPGPAGRAAWLAASAAVFLGLSVLGLSAISAFHL